MEGHVWGGITDVMNPHYRMGRDRILPLAFYFDCTWPNIRQIMCVPPASAILQTPRLSDRSIQNPIVGICGEAFPEEDLWIVTTRLIDLFHEPVANSPSPSPPICMKMCNKKTSGTLPSEA